jgi:hypothetical protein
MPETPPSRSISWIFVVVWVAVFLWDLTRGLPDGAGLALLIAGTVSLAAAWRWPAALRFEAIQRLALLPVIAWAIFICFALLLNRLGEGISPDNAWAIRPLLSWSGFLADLIVAAGTAVVLVPLFRSQVVPWAIAASAIAAGFVLWIGQSLRLYAVVESVLLVVAVAIMTYGASSFTKTLPNSKNELS